MVRSTDSVPGIGDPDGTQNHPIPRQSDRIALEIVRPWASARAADARDRLVE
jgi:hypothetical protein